MYDEKLKEFTKLYNELSSIYGNTNVFMDFVKICAIAIYNAIAKNAEMEKEYLRTINGYQKEHHEKFVKMFALLIMMYEISKDEICDILGPFYEKEHLGNSHLGQFFTPKHISSFMSKVLIEDENKIENIIKEKGFISIHEPTCGAGGMILSMVRTLKEKDINYQQCVLVNAIDISEVCAYMTYIQLSLYGVPAVVYCGDALTQQMRFKMETPFFFKNYLKFRKFNKKTLKEKEEELHRSKDKIVIKKTIENQNILKEVIVKENCQISLW